MTDGTTNKTVDCLDGFQYTNEILEFFPTAEGYVTVNTNQLSDHYNYVFNYTDHTSTPLSTGLGNIRLKYTAHPQTGEPQPLDEIEERDSRTPLKNRQGREQNHYYPFGLEHKGYQPNHKIIGFDGSGGNVAIIPISANVNDPYKYKFGGKEYQEEFDVNTYDFGARNGACPERSRRDPALGRRRTEFIEVWMNVDPLAEEASDWTPYRAFFNNPIRYIDPTGMFEGDFIDENGKLIGNDGIEDNKVYVVKTTQKSFSTGQTQDTPSAGISKKDAKATKDFIKNNSGNTEAFQNSSIAYDNSVEIAGSSDTRQAMVNIVNQDNGKGGTSDANNREYGGSINRDGTVTQAPARVVGNPLKNSNINITLTTTFENQSTFHSHASGSRTEGNRKGSWAQPPSYKGGDVQNSGSALNYVFGRGDGTIYIYNNKGVQATIPQKHFVNPKK